VSSCLRLNSSCRLTSSSKTSKAKLPETYKHAVAALAECESLDEVANWPNKAAALASSAKQADNPELENMARRIRARVVRRCGQLLEEIDGRGGNRSKKVRRCYT
jgi:hypothetical protein